MIITFRPEFAPPWVGRPHVTLLNLNRLPRRQRAEMISPLTGRKALPKQVADQIVDRTDGVPLFIEELTKTVIESGIVIRKPAITITGGAGDALAIPTSLHASLLARLDRLRRRGSRANRRGARPRVFTRADQRGCAEFRSSRSMKLLASS